MMTIRRGFIIAIVFLSLFFQGCSSKKVRYQQEDVSDTALPLIKIHRYELSLFAIDSGNILSALTDLQQEYELFLGSDPISQQQCAILWDYISDPQIIELSKEIEKKYPDLSSLEASIAQMLRYFHHYFPEEKIEKVFTYISGLAYEEPIIVGELGVIIALDMYMGKTFPPYTQIGLPRYKSRNCEPDYIPIDFANALSKLVLPSEFEAKTLIDKMIYEGKKLYFSDALLPYSSDTIKIKYTDEHLQWCIDNEKNIWTFFMENNLLFSTKTSLIHSFMVDGPFTHDFGLDSAPRIGHWIGWQIVRSFMEKNPQVSLYQLIEMKDGQDILSKSGYKP